jgi:hypothetical protein
MNEVTEVPSAEERLYQTVCKQCGVDIFIVLTPNQKRLPEFCRREHKKLYNLAHATDADTQWQYLVEHDELAAFPPFHTTRESALRKAEYAIEELIARQQRRQAELACPTPKKKSYSSLEEAQAFLNETHPEDKGLHPYECNCGAIHTGHNKKLTVPTEIYEKQQQERRRLFDKVQQKLSPSDAPRHVITCQLCGAKVEKVIQENQRTAVDFCSATHRKIFNLAKKDPGDPALTDHYLALVKSAGLEPDMDSLIMSDKGSDGPLSH